VVAITGATAFAHPHVWVTIRGELVFAPDGTVVGVRHAWTFDDMFSAFAIQGIEAKKKGEFTREELAPLAEVNVTSLKEYDYFTYAAANGKKLAFVDPPAGYYLDFDKTDTVLTLHFMLPLKQPLKAKDLTVAVYDPEFFIAFSLAEKEPAKLVGAPANCKLMVGRPQDNELYARLAVQPAPYRARSDTHDRRRIRQQAFGEMPMRTVVGAQPVVRNCRNVQRDPRRCGGGNDRAFRIRESSRGSGTLQ
jgi:ABC-type uncharacterized transport system substrate-binding protein